MEVRLRLREDVLLLDQERDGTVHNVSISAEDTRCVSGSWENSYDFPKRSELASNARCKHGSAMPPAGKCWEV